MILIQDTREQYPLTFPRSVTVEVTALKTGDYTMPGCEHIVAVERKDIGDLINCCTHDRERFEREIARLSLLRWKAVVIEGSLDDVAHAKYRSQVSPHAILGSILSWQMDHGVPFIFAGSRISCAAYTLKLFELATRYIERDERLLQLRSDTVLADAAMKRPPRRPRTRQPQ